MSETREKGAPEMKEKSGSSAKDTAAPVTPQGTPPPEAAADETQEWVITFKPATGETVKIEKLDKVSGARQELTPAEYSEVAAMGCAVPQQVVEAATDPNAAAYESMINYIAAVSAAAYYQGIADYATLAASPISQVQGAYYQGMLDAASM